MTPRWVAFGIFLAAILITGYCRRHESTLAGYVAARDLPSNTRITPGLWTLRKGDTPVASWGIPKEDMLNGKYVREPIKKDDLITPENLSDSPTLTFGADLTPFTSNLNDVGSLSGYVNAGGQISICDQDTQICSGGPYKVIALIGRVDSQLVLLLLTKQESEEVRKIKKPILRIVTLP
jgi:hypothetical protein